jgi:EpsI family protein
MTYKPFIISCIFLLMTIGFVSVISFRGEPEVVATNLENLPLEVAGYKATEDFFSEGVYRELNADKHVYRHYRSREGKLIDLYIGYYGTAKGGRTGHNPYACLPGAGWGIQESQAITIEARNYLTGVKVNYLLSRKGDNYQTIIHWYQSAGRKVLPTGIHQNIQRFIGRILHNRNDGAYIQISSLTDRSHIERAKAEIKFFAEEILHLLPEYWPVER